MPFTQKRGKGKQKSKAQRIHSCPYGLAAWEGTLNFACSIWFATVYAP